MGLFSVHSFNWFNNSAVIKLIFIQSPAFVNILLVIVCEPEIRNDCLQFVGNIFPFADSLVYWICQEADSGLALGCCWTCQCLRANHSITDRCIVLHSNVLLNQLYSLSSSSFCFPQHIIAWSQINHSISVPSGRRKEKTSCLLLWGCHLAAVVVYCTMHALAISHNSRDCFCPLAVQCISAPSPGSITLHLTDRAYRFIDMLPTYNGNANCLLQRERKSNFQVLQEAGGRGGGSGGGGSVSPSAYYLHHSPTHPHQHHSNQLPLPALHTASKTVCHVRSQQTTSHWPWQWNSFACLAGTCCFVLTAVLVLCAYKPSN